MMSKLPYLEELDPELELGEDLKAGIEHNNIGTTGTHHRHNAPISIQYAWAPSRAHHTARGGWLLGVVVIGWLLWARSREHHTARAGRH